MPNAPGWMTVLMLIGFRWYKTDRHKSRRLLLQPFVHIVQFLWKLTKGQRWKLITRNLASHKNAWVSHLLCWDPQTLRCIVFYRQAGEPRGETGCSEAKVIATDCRAYEEPCDAFKVVMLNWWFKLREMLQKLCKCCTVLGCCCSGWPSGVPYCSFISTRSVWMEHQECPWRSFYKTLACLL